MPDSPLDWGTIQARADEFLARGICALRKRPFVDASVASTTDPGNYLFSLEGRPMYIGEAGDLDARLRQQLNGRTSTFYKNYLKSGVQDPAPITAFSLQHMTTCLGRKEIEDFGIANLPTPLNRFQLGKRAVRESATSTEAWMLVQDASDWLLAQGEAQFWTAPQSPLLQAIVPARPGVYALWAGTPPRVIYIGESSILHDRHKTHCTQTYFSAPRRNIGTILLGFELHEVHGKRRYFSEGDERSLNAFLGECRYQFLEVRLGRLELEERLIACKQPVANRKGTERMSIHA
jgi:hypothetical protein